MLENSTYELNGKEWMSSEAGTQTPLQLTVLAMRSTILFSLTVCMIPYLLHYSGSCCTTWCLHLLMKCISWCQILKLIGLSLHSRIKCCSKGLYNKGKVVSLLNLLSTMPW
jgi:hypothetical protein